MKKILSVALIAIMLLSLSAFAVAEDDTSVFIPNKIAKLGIPDHPINWIQLDTKSPWAAFLYIDDDGDLDVGTGAVGDEIELFFSRKPDWAGVIWAEGFENLDVDDDGYAVTSREGHMRQPGTWSASGPCDPLTGIPAWHVTGGDYAYMAGYKNMTMQYGRSGRLNYLDVSYEEDYFATGIEGATTVVRYIPAHVDTDCGWTIVWYADTVKATYPEGNYIAGVEAKYRNDAANTLASYKISYATSETEIYKITYAPSTNTVVEDHFNGAITYIDHGVHTLYNVDDGSSVTFNADANIPSSVFFRDSAGGVYAHAYTADEPLYGEYYKTRQNWIDGNADAVTGSGNKINNWYKPGHGKQVKGLKRLSSFKSVRRTVK